MIRKIYVDEITKLLIGFVGQVDSLVLAKKQTQENLDKEIHAMKGKYTDNYIKEYKNNYRFPNYKQQMNAARTSCAEVVNYYLDVIEKQLDSYFMAPVRTDFANKINSIKITGLKLSDSEFEMLSKSAKSYMEMRLLNQLAETRTKTETRTVLNPETRTPEYKTEEAAAPYMYIKVPNLDSCYNAFKDYKRNVNFLLNNYCGKNAELVTSLESGNPDYIAISADSYFRNKSADTFNKIMTKQGEILKNTNVKKTLTERDKKVIDSLIDIPFPDLYKDKVKNKIKIISEAMPEMGELIRLDERYNKYVED